MKCRKFNNFMPRVNEQWAARVLAMERNLGKGPDLIDDGKFVEIKFCLINPKAKGQNYPRIWTVLEYQTEYTEIFAGQGFWGLGLYELDRPVKQVRTADETELEKMVVSRELWLVDWNWIYQFEPHRTHGKTFMSKWDNTLRYPKMKMLPKIKASYEVEKGIVHLTKGVPKYMFKI